jgi:hypothetical protein
LNESGYILESHKPLSQIGTVDLLAHSGRASGHCWTPSSTNPQPSTPRYGQTKVVNRMIMHILCMYNSNHPHTWDAILPYVQHRYNRALHSSTGHNPFQVGLGFQPLGPIDVALPLAVTSTDSSPAPTEADKATRLIEWIQHIRQQVQDILQKSNDKYKQHHDQHRVPHKFQVGNKVWLHLQKEHLTRPHRKLFPLLYGLYTITKATGDNSFELNIPPFLGLHPVFNVDLLRPYFPPLLDTSEIEKQLTPTELNPMTTYNRNPVIILWKKIQGHSLAKDPTLSSCQSRVAPAPRQVAHQGPNSTEISSSNGGTQQNGDHCFLRGRIDPDGYRWPPTYSNWLILAVFQFNSFFLVFRSLTFGVVLRPYNNIFRAHHNQKV